MDDLQVLIDIQKEALQMLLADHSLKEVFHNVTQKNSKVEHSDTFVGFVVKKSGIQGDIGFPVKKLENWGEGNECCYMKILENFEPQYVASIEYNHEKNVAYTILNKKNILETLLKSRWRRNVENRKNTQHEKSDFKCILECHLDGPVNSVVNIRTLLYALFLKRLLSCCQRGEPCILCNIRNSDGNGQSIHTLSHENILYIENELSMENVNMQSNETQHEDCTQAIVHLKDKFPQFITQEKESIQIDGKRLVEEFIYKKGIYSKDIGFIQVLDKGEPTSNLHDAATLKSLLNEQVVNVVHIVANRRSLHIQKSALLFKVLSNVNSQKFCVFEEQPASMMDSFLETRKEELLASYQSKYGSTVTGIQWKETIKKVAVASLTLDIFSLSLNNQLKMESVEDVSCLSSRKSLFILYNYARLCKLQEHFEEKVHQGVYEPLPDIEDVSFSLLTEESEWKLVVQYILLYPSLLHHIQYSFYKEQSGHVHLPVNQLCKFLCDLCHDFSSYYHQTKILLDPRAHLSPLMFARLYLILTLKEVMGDCFMLLGIVPPEQM